MDDVKVVGYNRNDFSKPFLNEKRREGCVPGVMYGVSSPRHFFIPISLLEPIIYNKELRLINFNLEGEMHKCVVRAVQSDPVNEGIIHVDFYEFDPNKKIKMKAFVKHSGLAEGVRAGGVLIVKKDTVTVLGVVGNIPNCIEVDVTNLAEGKTIRVADIEKSDKYTILEDERVPLFTIRPARK